MTLLRTERDTLDEYLPGLDKYLSGIPLLELETPGSGALAMFRELGGPALLVPAEYGGKGASLLDAVRIQRAVGSRSPSLAVATTMHHFSVASLVELTAAGNGFEWAMLMAIAENSWLLSSGFAEGKPGQHILTPTMRGVAAEGGITVSGVKKPCSLTWSMNLMSASVAVADPDGGPDRMAVVLIPAESDGIERAPFWKSTALAAAESDQVTLDRRLRARGADLLPAGQRVDGPDPGTWFRLVRTARLGVLPRRRDQPRRARHRAREGIGRGSRRPRDRAGDDGRRPRAGGLDRGYDGGQRRLARPGALRAVRDRASDRAGGHVAAAAAAGGMAFIESPEIAYLLGATRALAFHPPSRAAAAGPIARYLAGGSLAL